jgi:hypothetical protein
MKLGKLLAAGKSIMGGQAAVSYRSSKQIYLPKFGSPKNPFKPGDPAEATETTPSPASPAPAPESRTGPTRLAPSNEPIARRQEDRTPFEADRADLPVGRTRGGSENVSLPGSGGLATTQTVCKPQTVTATTKIAHVGPRFSAIQPINSLFSIFRAALPRKARRPEIVARSHNGMPTQTELSLDAVKVVHNDLSDVDVEVVPIKSRAGAPDLPAPRKSWEFVGERLFGVEAT